MNECEACWEEFYPLSSDAEDPWVFCSSDCEDDYYYEENE